MSNNPVRVEDLIFDDCELLIRPMSIEAVYKKNYHNNMWDVDIYLINGKVITITLNDDIVNDAINRLFGLPKDCENAV